MKNKRKIISKIKMMRFKKITKNKIIQLKKLKIIIYKKLI